MLDQYHIDKKRARASFGRAAETYDAAAILQKLVRDEMLSRLDLVNINPHAILDAGCGTGAGSHALQKRFTKAQVVSLDFAMPMLQKTRSTKRQSGLMHQVKSIFGNANSHCICADIEALPLATASIGLLWSNLAIQWCNDLPAALAGLYRQLAPGGTLAFTTLTAGSLPELNQAWQAIDNHPHANRFLPESALSEALAGYRSRSRATTITLSFPNALSAMRSLKGIGATHLHQGRSRQPLTRGRLQQLELAWPSQAGKCPLTYHLFTGVITRD